MAHTAELDSPETLPGMTPEMAPGPVGGPGAWRGSALRQRPEEWTYTLSAAEIAELDSAMRQSRGRDIIDIGKDDFPLPVLGPIFDDMRRELLHGRGFFLIRGIPVRDYTMEESARVYWGLGAHFGTPRSQNGKGQLLGHVCDLGSRYDAMKKPATSRIYQTRIRQRFHTDSTDFVSLLCLQKSKSGGGSSICSSVAVHDEMYRRAPDLLAELYRPFWRDRRGEVPPGRRDYYPMAAFHYHAGLLSAIYARDYIESCSRFPELPAVTDRQVAALDLFDSLVESKEFRLDMAFEPGDVQMLHNHQILHAREDFEDWPEVERKRHLLRLWLCPPDGRPLPDSFEERYLKLDIGDRGGIIGGDSRLNVPLDPV
ncbi:MAG: TauD/TfdA family dioxygenase [Proteobacteria bacterium]|nr:TauD/TfdA family dioxygenase [Pseudomonadota bacterium]